MTGQIPKYGKHFTRVSLPYSPGYASRKYVLKANASVFIQSTSDSEHWGIYVNMPCGDTVLVGKKVDTMGEAMPRAIHLGKIWNGE